MASDDDPFVTLGIETSASPDEIRLAYLQLLREHQESGSTSRIPRLMRAYELAFALAQMRDEAAAQTDDAWNLRETRGPDERRSGEGWYRAVSDPFRRPVGGWSSDPLVTRVRRHIEERAFDEAVAVATSQKWQEHMAEGADAFAHATTRLACATVWAAPEAYERLAQTYLDRLDDLATEYCGSALPLMLALDSDWAGWQSFRSTETWLGDFLQFGMSGDRAFLRSTARQIRAILDDDPQRLFAQLESMASLSPALVAFTAHVARSIPPDLSLPTFPEQDMEEIDAARLRAVFPRTRIAMLLPLMLVPAVLWPVKIIPIALFTAGALIYRDAYYGASYRMRVRPRLFEFCLQHQLPPHVIVGWAAQRPWISRVRPYAALVDDVVLDAAYALARLAHLMGPK